MKIGLKIWSINYDSFNKLAEFHKNGLIDYVELYIVPNSFDEEKLKPLLGIPIIFHAPNFYHKFSLCQKDKIFEDSLKTIRKFVDFFKEKRIIFHPGVILEEEEDDIEKTIDGINSLKDQLDIILENVPKIGYQVNVQLLAAIPDEFKKVLKSTGVKSCLDLGHAIASANHYRRDPIEFIKEFISFGPYMIHISDGDYSSVEDSHQHLGEGDYPLKELVKMIPKNCQV